MSDKPPCPVCGGITILMYGCGWDYDRWICGSRGCPGEVELETVTYPEEEQERTSENG